MKKKTQTMSSLIAIALLAGLALPASAQTYESEALAGENSAEKPPTLRMRVSNIESRHQEALGSLLAAFNRVPSDPGLISSKELVDAIDQGDRAFQRTREACKAVRASLTAEAKSIAADSSFSDEQKQELQAAVDAMIQECEALSTKAGHSIKALAGAYKAMPKWRKIHKTYLNLENESKATEHLKKSVDEFVASLTAAPEEPAAAEPGAGDSSEASAESTE